MATDPFEPARGGARLYVRLAPKAARDRLGGIEAGADGRYRLKVAVTAAPERGRANAALVALIAKALGRPKSRIRIAGGQTSRNKTLALEGETDALLDILRQRFGGNGE